MLYKSRLVFIQSCFDPSATLYASHYKLRHDPAVIFEFLETSMLVDHSYDQPLIIVGHGEIDSLSATDADIVIPNEERNKDITSTMLATMLYTKKLPLKTKKIIFICCNIGSCQSTFLPDFLNFMNLLGYADLEVIAPSINYIHSSPYAIFGIDATNEDQLDEHISKNKQIYARIRDIVNNYWKPESADIPTGIRSSYQDARNKMNAYINEFILKNLKAISESYYIYAEISGTHSLKFIWRHEKKNSCSFDIPFRPVPGCWQFSKENKDRPLLSSIYEVK